MGSLGPTFVAAVCAVGTAATMAFAGFYIHRRKFVTPSGKKMLALLSQQVTVSLLSLLCYAMKIDTILFISHLYPLSDSSISICKNHLLPQK
jgi:hypothetical protein